MDPVTTIVVLVYGMVFAVLFAIVIPQRIAYVKSERELKRSFSEGMLRGLEDGSIQSVEDVQKLYEGCRTLSKVPEYYCDLQRDLTEFHARLIRRDPKLSDKEPDANQMKTMVRQTSQLIDKLAELAPLAELPEVEGSILKDASSFLDKNDHAGVKRKLSEISVAIRTRHEELAEAKRWKNTSLFVAIVSVALTVYILLNP